MGVLGSKSESSVRVVSALNHQANLGTSVLEYSVVCSCYFLICLMMLIILVSNVLLFSIELVSFPFLLLTRHIGTSLDLSTLEAEEGGSL